MRTYSAIDAGRFSPYNFGSQAPVWWGMIGLIVIESTVFGSLIASYFYLGMGHEDWPPPGIKDPDLLLPTIGTAALLLSSVPMLWADRGIRRGELFPLRIGLLISLVLGLVFLGLKVVEYSDVEYRWDSHAYGSIVWIIIGFHGTHVVALALKTVVVSALAWLGFFTRERRLGVTTNGLYWHFVVIVWIPLYLVLYWSPRLF